MLRASLLLCLAGAVIACKPDECEEWCRLEADCRRAAALDWLGQTVEQKVAECGYRDEEALRSDCRDGCNAAVAADAASVEPCVACISNSLSMGCNLDGPYGACGSACGNTASVVYPLTRRIEDSLTCWLGETSIPMPPICEVGPRDPKFNIEPNESWSGLARVLEPSLTLLLANGATLTVSGSDIEYPPLTAGTTVAVDFISQCWTFFCLQSLVLRDMQDNLQFAAWKGSLSPPVPEIELSYDHAPCASIHGECAHSIGLDLVARSDLDAVVMRVPAGSEVDLGGLRIVNGRSVSLFRLLCTDTSDYYVTGFLRRL